MQKNRDTNKCSDRQIDKQRERDRRKKKKRERNAVFLLRHEFTWHVGYCG